MNQLTLISASYNTPEITLTMLKSFFYHHPYEINVLISENSTNDNTEKLLLENKVPFLRCRNQIHGLSVNKLIEKCITKYALLVDTDVIFLKNHEDILQRFIDMDLTLLGEVCGDRGGKKLHNRVHPWHCFLNIENIKKYNINFYDLNRQAASNSVGYDIGATFFEDIRKAKLKIGNINLSNDYYYHYEGMSWRTLKYNAQNREGNIDIDPSATHNNSNLFYYGQHVENLYKKEIEKFKNVKIHAKNSVAQSLQ